MRTRVRGRFGLVQGMSRVPGFEGAIDRGDMTAAAGPVLAVDRRRFLALGGYDPIYFPGPDRRPRPGISLLDGRLPRLLRARIGRVSQGLRERSSLSWAAIVCAVLASRNTLIFMWKNTSGARLLHHFLWLPVRLAQLTSSRAAELRPRALRGAQSRAVKSWRPGVHWPWGRGDGSKGQEAFFRRFQW